MAILSILRYPDARLHKVAAPVTVFDAALKALVRDMAETMYAAPGIGLAANQVGVGKRVCIVDLSVGETPGELKVLINPRIVETGGADTAEEGCLSFPDITLDLERPQTATVEAQGLDGKTFRIEAEGLLARAMQHEIEHLEGRTFLQNVSSLRRELVKRQIKKRIKAGDWGA